MPRQLAVAIQDSEVTTVQRLGRQGLRNGDLLQWMVNEEIGVLVTPDRNFEYRQDLGRFGAGLVALVSQSNIRHVLLPLGERIAVAIVTVEPGTVVDVRANAATAPALSDSDAI